ncbi:aminodeoxychorismate synthase component I [Stutzerimonas urumqiensis]|uniref:aminodeoxychorismate synthase component I n=1 Tax=Stutzerimonas urumqiensis TaxID=638269 RepID=UPI003BAB3C26
MPTCRLFPLPYQPDPGYWFGCIHDAPGAVLLDSGRPGATRGRFDILSAEPLLILEPARGETGSAFFDRLREALSRLAPAYPPAGVELPFTGGLIGMLSYDFGRSLEPMPVRAQDDTALPQARLGLYDWAIVSDHQLGRSQLVCHPSVSAARVRALLDRFEAPADRPAAPFRLTARFTADLAPADYHAALERIQAYIQAGDCYQVNYAQRFVARYEGSPWQAYRRLRAACPTPFAGYLATSNGAILSLSPERFLSVRERQVETRPIKGTRRRGVSPAEDTEQIEALRRSEKDRAENLMIVDLLRNDLGRNCAPGSVRVPELFSIETYPNVHHLVSAVTGTLASGRDALDLVAGSFPGGSITGAPKIRAMQIIEELEPHRRAIYCGSLLYLDVRGYLDSSIAIRSLLLEDGRALCWGGGGIVADSVSQDEYEESVTKVSVLLETLQQDAV